MEERLKELIADGKVIPFVGAGVSMDVKSKESNKSIFPSWTDLLIQLADELQKFGKENEKEHILSSLKVEKDYLSIADDIKEFFPTDKFYNKALKEIFDIKKEEIDDNSLGLARAIWSLGQKLIITTNYDKILHWASSTPDNTKYWDIQAIYEQASSLRDGVHRDTVWHIHGHIDNIDNIVLTTDSYNRLYNNSSDAEFKTALSTLQNYLSQKSFLFIGYSLEDKFFVDELIKVCDTFGNSHSEHYILLHKDRELNSLLEKKIIPIHYEDYGQPLIDKIKYLAPNI